MARLISPSETKRVLGRRYDMYGQLTYPDICDAVDCTPKIDAIPVGFIMEFAKTHDPVYQSNLASLIRAYNKETKNSDRIPEDLFEF